MRSSAIRCNRHTSDYLCHACQLGRHVRLPFHMSTSRASRPFELIHCDLWTSPITSVSGHKYYLVVLDDFSHYLWTFPLRLKSDTFSTLSDFFAYARTQFGVTVQGIQCDNGREFDNSSSRVFFLANGVRLRMSCPYTSPQNGKAERIIRTVNNTVRSLLFQGSVPPRCWAVTLTTATYLLNILPTKTLNFSTPHLTLFGTPPSYDHLSVFGCKCYPNLSATVANKLSPRSALCVFLGYSPYHKGYICLDRHTNRTIISRHVLFEESSFPFAESFSSPTLTDFDFLEESAHPVVLPFPSSTGLLPAGSSAAPHAAPASSPAAAPRAASTAPTSPAPRAATASSPAAAPRAASTPALPAPSAATTSSPAAAPRAAPEHFGRAVYSRRAAPPA